MILGILVVIGVIGNIGIIADGESSKKTKNKSIGLATDTFWALFKTRIYINGTTSSEILGLNGATSSEILGLNGTTSSEISKG